MDPWTAMVSVNIICIMTFRTDPRMTPLTLNYLDGGWLPGGTQGSGS